MHGGISRAVAGARRYLPAIPRSIVPISIALAALPATAHAQAGVVGHRIPVCVALRDPAATSRALFAAPARFDCTTDQTSLGSGDYDVLSAPLPARTATRGPVTIRTASAWQRTMTLEALYADGSIAAWKLDGRGITRHLQLGAIVQVTVPARPVPVVRLLWRIEGAANLHGIVNGASVAAASQSAGSNLVLAALYAGFAGLCIALLIYNLALWRALRHRFQVAYCALVAALLVYVASSSGALAWVLPDIANNDRMRINYVALAAAAIAAIAFARRFFEKRVFAGWLGQLSTMVSYAVGGAAVLVACAPAGAVRWFDRAYASAFLLVLMLIMPVLWRAWRLRSNYLWLFAAAWMAPVAVAGLRVASNFNLIRWSFWLNNSTIAAMALEAVLSTLAIAHRIHLLSRERDEAREQEIAARLLAATDPLTGLLNRRAFLEQAIGRDGDQILLLADIDHFKRVNETIGHDGGDEVLRVVSRALRAAVPPDALVARVGGEEFAIVAPAAARLSGASVLNALRAERMPFDLSVTASIGTCIGPLMRETDWKSLYRSADRALFAAKAAGRDRARDAESLERAA